MKSIKTISRVALCLLLCGVLLCGALSVYAAPTTKGSAQDLGQSGTVQGHLDGMGTANWYKITPNAAQYYRFTFYNQSVETRLGISIADSLLNLFLGKMSIVIYDSYDAILAEGDVKCGYTGSVSLRLEKGQTYYVKLTSTVAGNYRMTTANFADVGANSWSGAEDMLSNGQLISSIEAGSDVDWFQFVADEEQSYYRFALENINGSGDKTFYLYEYVAGAGETPLRDVWHFSVGKGKTGSKDAQLKEGHTYYYRIAGSTGGYQLNVSQTLDVAGPDFETAYAIDTDTKYTTSFDADGDTDYFKFTTGNQPAYYHFDLDMLSDDNCNLYFRLYDAAGNEIGKHDIYTGYLPKTVNYKLEPDSTYYLRLSKGSSKLLNYTVKINTQVDADANEPENATKITLDQQFTASFDGYGDTDYFQFTTGNQVAFYHFEMDLLHSDNCNIYYRIYDEDDNEIGKHDIYSGYFPKTVNYRLEANRTYYFLLEKYTDKVGNYTVKVKTQVDAHPEVIEEAVAVERDREYTASFDGYGDTDFFKFTTGSKNAYYYFNMDLLHDDNCNIYYRIYDDAGNEIGKHDIYSGYFPASKYYKLEPNRTYYFLLAKYTDKIGNYTFSVETVEDLEGNSMGEALPIKLNKPATYRLATDGDVDWFTFSVDYDNDYRIRFNNETGGNIKAYLYNEYEKEIKYLGFSSGRDEVISLTAGKYYVKVLRDYGSPKYYTMAVADCGGGHEGKVTYPTKATTSRDGVKRTVCKYCGATMKTEKVARLSTVKLSKTKWSCTGKTLTPTVKVTDADGKTVSSSYYTLKTSATGKTPGKYTVTVTFKGKYSGTKKLSYTVVLATPKVTAKGSSSSIKVTWNKVPAATTYAVYRRQYVSGKWSGWTKVKTTKSTSYTHSGPTSGRLYRYAVKAYRGSAVSEMGSSVSAVRLAKPTSMKASGKTAANTISWKKVSGAKGYYVYARKYSGGKWGSWSKIKVTTATSYTHKSASYGVNYQYRVCSYYGDSVGSYGTTVSAIRLKAPSSVKAAKSGSAVKATWSKVSGASGYLVYRRTYNARTGKYGSWVKIKATTARSYTDKGAKKGVYYQYGVLAYKGNHISNRKLGNITKR